MFFSPKANALKRLLASHTPAIVLLFFWSPLFDLEFCSEPSSGLKQRTRVGMPWIGRSRVSTSKCTFYCERTMFEEWQSTEVLHDAGKLGTESAFGRN